MHLLVIPEKKAAFEHNSFRVTLLLCDAAVAISSFKRNADFFFEREKYEGKVGNEVIRPREFPRRRKETPYDTRIFGSAT